MTTVQEITHRGDAYVLAVNTALDEYLSDFDLPQQSVVNAMRYSLLSGGKRIRAILLLEFCRMCGGDTQTAMPFACAVEMLHCYSLIHDDLPCMDDDDLRRGIPSCHIKFGEAIAVLAGDALLTLAFDIILNPINPGLSAGNTLKAAGLLARAAGYKGMVGGQVIDMECSGADDVILTHQNELKTGAVIRAAVMMGCIAADADDALIRTADDYAEKIGLSFQIVDDILDMVGSTEEIGKPAGSDAGNKKTTFATLYGVEKSRNIVDQLVNDAKAFLKAFPFSDDFIYSFTDALSDRKS